MPNVDNTPNIKAFKFIKTRNQYERTIFSTKDIDALYDKMVYAITIRSIMELFHYDNCDYINSVVFNGVVESIDKGTGLLQKRCILSVQVNRELFSKVNIREIDPKSCFKYLNGVGSAKLHSLAPIAPIMNIDKEDKRFVDSKDVAINEYTNLAAMDWEEFEHLIRELFEKEFNQSGGEVKITQSSRDGGVDAIAFDPDPIRGGKIVIQAKRYTNTVGVSAVRDLYGTVMNEGANKGILVTTSDYGADSYEFAKDKPLTLLNGGHVLHLLEKFGQKAIIDIEDAKLNNK